MGRPDSRSSGWSSSCRPRRSSMRFNFLVYAGRSGSTLLASCLAAKGGLLVMPEFRLVSFLLARGDSSVRRMTRRSLGELMAIDIQLRETLGFGKAQLETLARRNAGEGIRRLIEDIVAAYGQKVGRAPGVVVLKAGDALYHHDRLVEVFPEARFVHIVRDGRGVVNSLLRTPRAFYENEDMGRGDVYHCARSWSRHLQYIEHIAEMRDVQLAEIRYEALLTSEQEVVAHLYRFLDVSPVDMGSSPFAVGPSERLIHPLLHDEPSIRRARAWQQELKRWHGIASELIAADALERYGYETYFRNGTNLFVRSAAVARAWLVHVVATPRWVARRLWKLRGQPRAILETARLIGKRAILR